MTDDETGGSVTPAAPRSKDTIKQDIAVRRSELVATVDALSAKLDLKSRFVAAARERPKAFAGAGAASVFALLTFVVRKVRR